MNRLPDPVDHRRPDYLIDPIFWRRWSPRAMSGESITNEELMRLFEAARWAPSTYNEQEWRFLYATRGGPDWAAMPWTARAAVFLKAAELLAGRFRATLNAATMLGQSKTAYQAEIDSACELVDFLRFNVWFARQIAAEQPRSAAGAWNAAEPRPLEGFVFAATPFNFTAIAGNLPCAPALMGNTVVWKPSANALYSAHFIMELLVEAGLPAGVINLVMGPPEVVANACIDHEGFAGLHFTGRRRSSRGCGGGSGRTSGGTGATRAWWARRAARTSCSPTGAPTWRRWPWRWCVGRTSTRGRSARRRRARTCRGRCGQGSAIGWWITSGRSGWATWRISATSWGP